MTEKYDEVEQQFGIIAYASSDVPGFAAVLKGRFSDFCVREVDTNGNMARLQSLEDNLNPPSSSKEVKDKTNTSIKTEESKKRDANDIIDKDDELDNNNKKPRIDDKDVKEKEESLPTKNNDEQVTIEEKMNKIKDKLQSLIGIESAVSVIDLLTKWETAKESAAVSSTNATLPTKAKKSPFPPRKGVEDETKYFTLPLIEDKAVRKEIHMLIKSDVMKDVSMADTVDKQIRVWHKIFERQMPNYKKFGTINKDRPQSKKKEWPKDRPDYLRFVLYKENIDTTTAIKDLSRIARIQPRGSRYHKGASGGITYAGMKDKRGVTAQYCTVFRKTPNDLLILNRDRKNAKGGGNTKYQGSCIMRVGEFSYVNKELRLGHLHGNNFEIALRNVCIEKKNEMTKQDMVTLTTQTLRDGANAMKKNGFINFFGMQRFGKFHDTHLVGIAVLKGDFKAACDLIMRVKPEEQERYKVIRTKWENRFSDIDLSDEEAANEAEMKCAREVLKGLGRFMNCETSIVHSLLRKPRDYKKAFSTISKNMRSMFLHAYQSYLWNKATSHRINDGCASEVIEGDLVLTVGGSNGGSGLKGKKVVVVSQDDVETGKYKIEDVVIPLVGTRTDLPTNSTGCFLEEMLEADGLTLDCFKKIKDRELALGGDYRKIICKPTDVDFEIKLYLDPQQPLIRTDLMTIQQEELDCVDVTSNLDKKNDVDVERVLVAMIIRFTLPPSAYATIALRELTKRPTSSKYQTALKLDGDCEGNI